MAMSQAHPSLVIQRRSGVCARDLTTVSETGSTTTTTVAALPRTARRPYPPTHSPTHTRPAPRSQRFTGRALGFAKPFSPPPSLQGRVPHTSNKGRHGQQHRAPPVSGTTARARHSQRSSLKHDVSAPTATRQRTGERRDPGSDTIGSPANTRSRGGGPPRHEIGARDQMVCEAWRWHPALVKPYSPPGFERSDSRWCDCDAER